MRRTALYGIALAFLLTACSSPHFDTPTTSNGSRYALGAVSEDRSLYFTEAENFKEKAGGDLDLKAGASKGQCLGMRWGAKATDFVDYGIRLSESADSGILVVRAALEGSAPQFYDVLVDGSSVGKLELRPTGGYGYTGAQWDCFSAPIGAVTPGPHILTLKPVRDDQIANLDCLVIGRSR